MQIEYIVNSLPGPHCHLDTRLGICYCWPDEVWNIEAWRKFYLNGSKEA